MKDAIADLQCAKHQDSLVDCVFLNSMFGPDSRNMKIKIFMLSSYLILKKIIIIIIHVMSLSVSLDKT